MFPAAAAGGGGGGSGGGESTQQHQRQHQNKRRAVIFQRVTHFPTTTTKRHGNKRKAFSSSDENQNEEDVDTEGEDDLHLNIIDATFAFEHQSSPSRSTNNTEQNQQSWQQEQKQQKQQLQPPTKRKKISLQMVDSRTMSEREFWKNLIQSSSTKLSSTTAAGKNANSITNTSSAATATAITLPQSTSPSITTAAPTAAATASMSKLKEKQKQKKKNIVLDPITQMINRSLSSLHPSNTTTGTRICTSSNDPTQAIMAHINTIQTNGLSKLRKYINWKCIAQPTPSSPSSSKSSTVTNGSTVLHMAALLNSTEAAQYICTNYSGIIDFNLVDDDGYTARDVAELVGSDGVAQVISMYMVGEGNNSSKKQCWGDRIIGDNDDGESVDFSSGGGVQGGAGGVGSGSSIRDSTEEEREEDYVYDVYRLKEGQEYGDDEGEEDESRIDSESGSKKDGSSDSMLSSGSLDAGQSRQREEFTFDDTDSSSDPILVLQGGVGYWNEKGELVLETSPIDIGHQSDIEEEDYDSNCEEYIGNDYPEDEDDDSETNNNEYYSNYTYQNRFSGGLNEEYDSDEDIYDMPGSSQFRNHAIDISFGSTNSHHAMYQYEDYNDDEGDGEYSGLMRTDNTPWNNEGISGKTEAYDPTLDRDSE